MDRQYNNELTPELLATMDKSPFTIEQLTDMDDEARALVREQDEYLRLHPVSAIWRQAVVGSLTRDGGKVSSASSEGEVITSSGKSAGFALVGDEVTYSDGSTAHIVSGSGSSISSNGKGYALVGSHLSNGDEIISTPQNYAVLCCHAGETMADDFLVAMEM
ncbi:PAAR domain-containing protein [Pectobacterium atrosepticum]|uniref:PAAR domain-containing protein n=1 Tax=Pectobacterium atrosepticum TaxID=29471 RepID=UPI000CDD6D5F|nr:PAAR domain-containing protein [Pectobacterium atrosepticum]POW26066.1 hypothetical protein PB72LOC_03233 [Pectobacterium atrosepticum]